MSSDVTDDYEVDVAPLIARSKTIHIEDEPSAPTEHFQLNPHVQLLTQQGKVQSLNQPRQLERLCPSVETRQLVKMLNNAETPSSATAEEVLAHLHDSFLPIPEFAYQKDKPSHAWEKGAIDNKSLHKLLMRLCAETEKMLRSEPMVLQFDGNPAYVMGDLHGNYKDLMQFADTFWKLGLKLCPARVVCLGDYVDRGPHSIETVAYLFAQKLLAPKKMSLLRGNHELKDVNGDVETYGAGSFLAQCRTRFGIGKGDELWSAANKVFDQMPVCAVLDRRIFCVHGGVPREAVRKHNFSFKDISTIPKGYVDTDDSEVLLDLLWADPSTNHEEDTTDHDDRYPDGFAPNNTRAGNTCLFGTHAVNQFMKRTGITHIIRAHQPPNLGISFGKRAQVITVFSSSHYCGGFNSAAVVLVADHKVSVIITSGAAGKQEEAAQLRRASSSQSESQSQSQSQSEEESDEADGGGAKKKRKNDVFKVPISPSTKRKAIAPPAAADAVRASAAGALGVKRTLRRRSGE